MIRGEAHGVPVHRDQPGWPTAPHSDHGTGRARRPLRARVRWPRSSGRRRTDDVGSTGCAHADQARPGAADPLHALARACEACMEIAQADAVADVKALRQSSLQTARACRSSSVKSRIRSLAVSLVMHAAWKLDQGDRRPQGSVDGEGARRRRPPPACDVAIQLNGARGSFQGTILDWIYRYAGQARLSTARRTGIMVLARFLRDEGRDFWRWSAATKFDRLLQKLVTEKSESSRVCCCPATENNRLKYLQLLTQKYWSPLPYCCIGAALESESLFASTL